MEAHIIQQKGATQMSGNDRTGQSSAASPLSRRALLKGSLATAAAAALGSAAGCRILQDRSWYQYQPDIKDSVTGPIDFKPLPPMTDLTFDSVRVPDGYTAEVFFAWGDPVENGAPPWNPDTNTGADQEKQAGQSHDGMQFFPLSEKNSHGLLAINHENFGGHLHGQKGFTVQTNLLKNEEVRTRPPDAADQVRKEQAAQGVSVIEIKKDASGRWQRVFPSKYNRRIHLNTPMKLSGPAAGDNAMITLADPVGRSVTGTMGNCAFGHTPWGTYLTCEEHWKRNFVNQNRRSHRERREQNRYGIRQDYSTHMAWESLQPRFNVTPSDVPEKCYVNESNKFGWVVEINPYSPESTPVKRTAMGRLHRECATLSLGKNNRMAFYSGDDDTMEYIYKFVPSKAWNPDDREANRDLLDEGTLYVARFMDDGRGVWLPLVHGTGPLTTEKGFKSQADVVINARSAADALGATPMDRPEWIAIHPENNTPYVSLTNNKSRGELFEWVNAANPRAENLHGHILRWQEENDDPTATVFRWEIFMQAGSGENDLTVPENLRGNIKGDLFSCPDGLWFDPDGRLWVQTDYGDSAERNLPMGLNQMLCANPETREVKRFLTGPKGCEITGITGTPDGKTLWVNIQHPGRHFPDKNSSDLPRSATVVITKDNGGVIGS
ncbi:MAG: PhoX family protein [Endozoicomonas sp.]